MAEIKNVKGQEVIDYAIRDYDSFLQSMKSLIPKKLPEWTDYNSEADFGNVLLQLFAHMGDILSYYQDRIANESFLGTAQTRRSIIHHLRLIGYKLSTAAPASTNLTVTFTVPADRNDTIMINKGDAFATKSQKDKPSVRFEYAQESPIKINLSALSVDPNNAGKKNFTGQIPVEEGRLVDKEIIGISDGTPNQRFTLAHSPLILRSLGQDVNTDILLTTDPAGTEKWSLLENLAFSREGRKDFTVDIDEHDRATIILGDGAFGYIPPSGVVIMATYRVGGGLVGNVPKDTIQTIVNAPKLAALAANVTNTHPATGGAERESLEHAVFHAPGVFRTLKRAVTSEDFVSLARSFTGVGKVHAEATNWNTVTLFIAPQGGGGQASDILKANLHSYFEDMRPVSTLIEIKDVDYVKIYVTAEIGVERYYDVEDIKAKTQKAVADLLAFDTVDFAETVYLSKFYEAIEKIQGVQHVTIKEFKRDPPLSDQDPDGTKKGKIVLGPNEIACVPGGLPEDLVYGEGCKIEVKEDR